ncbi:MAG: hypothetical protein SCARUB_04199 [Candidatus Scalindua rubra]|uniref:Uncharacterized protein n=1 Tax=Candidatus Scalindua rubra TaxID=1872076 RepID=A0A1E3X564_9BACT|nr:MAG: hypothetical protein SCARUB_04199 [Candidatus Scalindua rubra]
MAENTLLEERVARLEGRVDEHSKFVEGIQVSITRMEKRFDNLDIKIDNVRNILEQKIEGLDKKIDNKIDGLDKKIDNSNRRMDTMFRWIVGIQITTWITIIMTILLKK